MGSSLTPTPVASACPSPLLSANNSEWEDDAYLVPISSLTLEEPDKKATAAVAPSVAAVPKPGQTTVFMSLPVEIRLKIYGFYFADVRNNGSGGVIDLDPDNRKKLHKMLAIFLVSRTVYNESSHYFFSTFPFRIFPTHPLRFAKARKPLLAKLKKHQRQAITSLELRVGPGWSKPPRSWVVTDELGLADCSSVRHLRVFVEFDPSCGWADGFRWSEGSYSVFCSTLLERVLAELPAVRSIEFDAYPSVQKDGPMVLALLEAAEMQKGVAITWGPESGWAVEAGSV